MKIGYIGMGKLGFPCALATAEKGHDVVGYDVNEQAYEILESRSYPHREAGAQRLLKHTTLRMSGTVHSVVMHADLVFIAVQTPHQPKFEGINRMPEAPADFDYAGLKAAVGDVAREAQQLRKRVTIAVISTCLPGTCDREIIPLLTPYAGFVYSPYFIAMGTTIPDYLEPEYQLLGTNNPCSVDMELVEAFYDTIHRQPHKVMSVASAELNKMGYNVFLGLKIVAANALMEIAHKTPGANVDDVTDGLALATERVLSARYMRGGMGDGGGCHPRDQIALSWLARKLDLSYDIFGSMVHAREQQTEWLAYLAIEEAVTASIRYVVVLGKAYKKGTNLTVGSPAILLKNLLDEFIASGQWDGETYQWDPHVDGGSQLRLCDVQGPNAFGSRPAVYVVGCDHDEFFAADFHLEPGSIVLDPWGRFADRAGIKVIRVGRG